MEGRYFTHELSRQEGVGNPLTSLLANGKPRPVSDCAARLPAAVEGPYLER